MKVHKGILFYFENAITGVLSVPVNIPTEAFGSAYLRKCTEHHYEQTLCHSVRNSKMLSMQPSDVVYDIMWPSYMSVKFAERLSI